LDKVNVEISNEDIANQTVSFHIQETFYGKINRQRTITLTRKQLLESRQIRRYDIEHPFIFSMGVGYFYKTMTVLDLDIVWIISRELDDQEDEEITVSGPQLIV
jgi:hypothetical protein